MQGTIHVTDERTRRLRKLDLDAQDRDEKARQEAKSRENSGFVQVYDKGWRRLQELMKVNASAARIYAFLAEHIDGSTGSVIVSQEVLAQELEVHLITVKRQTKLLEDAGAIVRIRVGTGVYAYALDPKEVWRSWDSSKDLAAFNTKTLVRKSDRENGTVRQKLKVMMNEREN